MALDLLTAEEVAKILRVRIDRVYMLVRQKLLPAIHTGRHLRFEKSQLEAWAASGGTAYEGGWRKEKQ